MNKSRRKLLTTTLASVAALISNPTKAAEKTDEKTVKVLTRDGKLLEIPASKVRTKRPAEKADIDDWTGPKAK